MIYYSADQLFDIIGQVSNETDLIEIEHYLLSNEAAYDWRDVLIVKECITDLYTVLQHGKTP